MPNRTAVAIAAGLFVSSFATYLLTLAPTFSFADTGELAVAVATGGVAHPPGFPLYLVLAGVFSHLPIGSDIAYRLNLFSAFAAALTAPTIYLMLRLALPAGRAPQDRREADGISRHLPPICGALLFVFSLTFWQQATITEVYTLNILMTSLVLLFGIMHLRLARRGTPSLWVLAALGLVAGLGAANHLTLGLVLPGIGLWFLISRRRKGSRGPRTWLIPLGAFLLGLCCYAILPLRAAADPVLSWGDVTTPEAFWRHIRAWQFKVNFKPGLETFDKQMEVFMSMGIKDTGLLPLCLLPPGILYLARRDRGLLAGMGVALAIPLAWALCYDIAEDQETYFLIPMLILSLVAGFGAANALEASRRLVHRPSRMAVAVLLLAVSACPLLVNFARADRSDETEARAYGMDLLENLQPEAIVFTRDWNLYSPTLYLQHVEGMRRDVDVVDLNLLKYSWYIPYLEQSAPRVLSGLVGTVSSFRRLQRKWEGGHLPAEEDDGELDRRYQALIAGMLTGSWRANRPVYATRELLQKTEGALERSGVTFYPAPETLAFRIRRTAEYLPLPDLTLRNTWEIEPADRVGRKAWSAYVLLWINRGKYFEAHGRADEAIDVYRRAQGISPGNEAARKALDRLTRGQLRDSGR